MDIFWSEVASEEPCDTAPSTTYIEYPAILGQAIAKSAPVALRVEPKAVSAQNTLRIGGSVISHLDERSRKPRQLNAINVWLADAALENGEPFVVGLAGEGSVYRHIPFLHGILGNG